MRQLLSLAAGFLLAVSLAVGCGGDKESEKDRAKGEQKGSAAERARKEIKAEPPRLQPRAAPRRLDPPPVYEFEIDKDGRQITREVKPDGSKKRLGGDEE